MKGPGQGFLFLFSLLQQKSRYFRSFASFFFGWLGKQEYPAWAVRRVINLFVAYYGIDLADFVVPQGGFKNFRDFHARELRRSKRRVDSQAVAVFPVDGIVLSHGRIRNGSIGQVKGILYSLDELVNQGTVKFDLRLYENGSYLNLYLPIKYCHRWYSPFDGQLIESSHIHGENMSLDLFTLSRKKNLYACNERIVQRLTSHEVEILLVAVGGIAATSIYTKFPTNSGLIYKFSRGQEMGGFYMGSSLVVLMPEYVQPGHFINESSVNVGQAMLSRRQLSKCSLTKGEMKKCIRK